MEEKKFEPFPKIARLSRDCTITEKLDGTNACIEITEDGQFLTASRTRWIHPDKLRDNYGFSAWAHANKEELLKLGVGRHFGEWWGQGIQRTYGQTRKIFSLFNTKKWSDASTRPACCDVVPVLYEGLFDTAAVEAVVNNLRETGSVAAPGFMRPEGVIVWNHSAEIYFKKTLEKDAEPKGLVHRKEPSVTKGDV